MPTTANIGLTSVIKFFPAGVAPADADLDETAAKAQAFTETIGQARSFSFPEAPTATIDVTNFDSDQTGRRETIGGLLDATSVTAEMIYKKSEADKFYNSTTGIAGVQKWWEVTLPDDSKIVFIGTPGAPGLSVEVADAITQALTITVDANPYFTPSA